jgi:23S rRNA pseudouridine1911/1915/1917 synthase
MGRQHYIDRHEGARIPVEQIADEEPESPDQAAPGPACFTVAPEHGGWRLDRTVAANLPSISRSRIQGWIEQGAARINSQPARTRDRVSAGDRVEIELRPSAEALAFKPEPIELAILYEDELLIVIDKPAGLVVHPGAGNWSGTLLNGLLAHHPALAAVPRAGIVHRLDAGTSGLMVVAKTSSAQLDLVRQLQQRSVMREYWAVVTGVAPGVGTIEAALSRDPRNRLRFHVSGRADARFARTRFRRVAVSGPPASGTGVALSWLACRLDTGRTHQIRVHLASIGHPLVGDPLYFKHRPALAGSALQLHRQALHACRLSLKHPAQSRTMNWFRPPPDDLGALMRSVGFDPDRPVDLFDAGAPQ